MPYSTAGMFAWAEAMCNRANVGYWMSYPQRNFMTINGITYFDCSSFTFFACWLGGGLDVGALGYSTDLAAYQAGASGSPNAWTVNSMIRNLQAAGWATYSPSAVTLQPGDILAKWDTHTEIYYGDNPVRLMGARNSSLPLADQVAIHETSLTSIQNYYNLVLRPDGGPTPPPGPTRPVPVWLIKRAIENAKGGMQM